MTVSESQIDHWRTWIGRTEEVADRVDAVRAEALAATLDAPDAFVPKAGDPLPLAWHWLYFWAIAAESKLGPDGHPRRGGFLPPVDLPRRMWAGGRLRQLAPLPIGVQATRTSRILDVKLKAGKRESLVFVTVEHTISAGGTAAVVEEQDIVYRPPAGPAAPDESPADARTAALSRTVDADAVMLFRYSALTFNGHRIHYDRSYVTAEEGYPGLIVHGPLTATLLLELARRELPQAQVSRFAFRAVRPIFDISPFAVHAQPVDGGSISAWATDNAGRAAMEATIETL